MGAHTTLYLLLDIGSNKKKKKVDRLESLKNLSNNHLANELKNVAVKV